MLLLSLSGIAQTTYTKITSTSGLEVGANYLIVAHHDDFGTLAMGYQKSNNRNAVVVSEGGNAITVTPGTDPTSTTYAKAEEECYIDEHMGFIKLGSRVDVFLPLTAKACVTMDQPTTGDQTVIAKMA